MQQAAEDAAWEHLRSLIKGCGGPPAATLTGRVPGVPGWVGGQHPRVTAWGAQAARRALNVAPGTEAATAPPSPPASPARSPADRAVAHTFRVPSSPSVSPGPPPIGLPPRAPARGRHSPGPPSWPPRPLLAGCSPARVPAPVPSRARPPRLAHARSLPGSGRGGPRRRALERVPASRRRERGEGRGFGAMLARSVRRRWRKRLGVCVARASLGRSAVRFPPASHRISHTHTQARSDF